MAIDDALQAAKDAALRALSEQLVTSTTAQLQSSVPSTISVVPSTSSSRRHRRRRKRRSTTRNTSITPVSTTQEDHIANDISDHDSDLLPDYEPEPVTPAAAIAGDVPHEVLQAMRRFERRGRGGDDAGSDLGNDDDVDDGHEHAAQDAVPGISTGTDGADGADAIGNEGGVDVATDSHDATAAANGKRSRGKSAAAGPSRKKRKEERRALITNLKWLSGQPAKIEQWDVTAPDPVLLAMLKTTRGSVTVPSNWSLKRKYLQNKRGLEKRAVALPAFIAATGVGIARDAQREVDDAKNLKQRQRERMRAKLGRGVELDERRLHDAFFKFQTRPRMTGLGDVYYELRELEVDCRWFKAGVISDELRAALGMTEGGPPPWLLGMQRWGPPPSWPGLKVPGVNAGIPRGGKFGYQSGGWGKPPVDENGRPVYGDVFGEGLEFEHFDKRFDGSERMKDWRWGTMRKEGTDEEDERDRTMGDNEEDVDRDEDEDVVKTVEQREGRRVVIGEMGRTEGVADGRTESTRRAQGVGEAVGYQLLQQRRTSVAEGAMMGSSHVYDMNGNGVRSGAGRMGERGGGGGESRRMTGGNETRRGDGRRSGVGSERRREFKF